MKKTIRLSKLATNFGFEFEGKDIEFDGLGLCNRETSCKSMLSYVVDNKYIANIKENEAISCLVLSESSKNLKCAFIPFMRLCANQANYMNVTTLSRLLVRSAALLKLLWLRKALLLETM